MRTAALSDLELTERNKRTKNLYRKMRIKQNIPLMIMFAPILLFFLIFRYIPMGGLIIAFKQYNLADGVFGSPWVGWRQFEILFRNPGVYNVIRNTLIVSLVGYIGFPVPIFLAILINEIRLKWYKRSAQTLLFLPHFLNWVIVGGIVITLFSNGGYINQLLMPFIGEPVPFLYNEFAWLAVFVGSNIWKSAGFSAIIYLAALSSIDPGLYESANIDGASKFRKMWHITLPGLRPIIVVMLILSTQNIMEVSFDRIYILQNPMVNRIAQVIPTYIYTFGLQGGQFSLSTAMGMFGSLVGLIMIFIANSVARKFNNSLW